MCLPGGGRRAGTELIDWGSVGRGERVRQGRLVKWPDGRRQS